jgi:hypothetical protein
LNWVSIISNPETASDSFQDVDQPLTSSVKKQRIE